MSETVRETPGPLLEWGVASRALAGEVESGDRHIVAPFEGGTLVGAVDGLGHGPEAAAAAEVAVDILEAAPQTSVIGLMRRCHEGLVSTRGVVMSLATFDARGSSMTWIGVGNVEGVLLRAGANATSGREMLLLRGGVVGYQLPQLAASEIPVWPGDTLIFATDGVGKEFSIGLRTGEPPQQLAQRILEAHGKGTDDALVVVARFVGPTPP